MSVYAFKLARIPRTRSVNGRLWSTWNGVSHPDQRSSRLYYKSCPESGHARRTICSTWTTGTARLIGASCPGRANCPACVSGLRTTFVIESRWPLIWMWHAVSLWPQAAVYTMRSQYMRKFKCINRHRMNIITFQLWIHVTRWRILDARYNVTYF